MSFRRHLLKRMKGEKELPYIQLDYIESTGTQYIDTGYIPTINTDIKTRASVKYNSGSTPVALFGYLSGNDPYNRYAVQYHKDTVYVAKGKTEGIISTIDYTKMCDIETKGSKYIYDGNVISIAPLDFSVPNKLSIVLFARRTTNVNRQSKSKIEFFKIYENGALVMDLIPCIRKSDGVVCMYDLISNSFFENEGTGSFIAGTLTNLPDGYAQVSYLESTGTQYIDIGLKVSNNTKVELVGKQYVASSSLFGVNPLFVITSVQSTDKKQLCRFRYNNTSQDTNVNILELSKITFDKNKGYINDVLLATFTEATFSSAYNAILFGRRINSSGALEELTQQRIDYFKMWENDILVRDMIPCLDEKGRPCMYDMVNYKTYYNQGEGEFLYGIKEPSKNLIKETKLGFPSSSNTSISVNSTYPYSYYMNDILLEEGKTYEVNVTYVREPKSTDDGTIRFRMLNEDGTFWGAPSSGTYTSFFDSVELTGKVGPSAISEWFSFQKAILKPKKNCYMRPLVILGTKAKTPPCAYFVNIKEV